MKKMLVAAAALAVGGFGLAACEIGATYSFTVSTSVDATDATPGDGVCEATTDQGDCTLRAAVG